MIDTDYEQQMLRIEAILEEADRHGLRQEVKQTAEKFLIEDPDLSVIDAYEAALFDWDCIG